ncbi:MAG: DUF3775 domain-containing protein [Paracoccaceae bacterium]
MRLSFDTVRWIVARAREIDAEDIAFEEDAATDTLGEPLHVVEDTAALELASWIADLTESEQAELVALLWIGRGDGEAGEFEALVEQARASKSLPTERYLLETPLLADYLEAGLDAVNGTASDD